MSNPSAEFLDLVAAASSGSDSAARELIDLYGDAVSRAVRRRLGTSLRTVFDSEDFTQAVWASFFTDRARLAEFRHPDDMVAFLASVARNKVVDASRRQRAQKRAADRNRSTDAPPAPPEAISARQATPSEIAVSREMLERIAAEFPPHYRQILEMRASGLTYAEVGEQLGMHEGSVRRIVHKIYRRVAAP
jgi:RNA polymerase sigma factor (sigma-70 family)